MKKIEIPLACIGVIIAGVAVWKNPSLETLGAVVAAILVALGLFKLSKKGAVSFSAPCAKIRGSSFEAGRIMAGSVTCELDVFNKTKSPITINGASIKISKAVEKFTGGIPPGAAMQNISAMFEPPRQSITIEPDAFITLRVRASFKSSDIGKFDQAKAIGLLSEKELGALTLKYKTLRGSDQHHVEIEFETSKLKAETRRRYEDSGDFEAIVWLGEYKA